MARPSSTGKSTPASSSFTDTKRVRELVQLMTENELTEIELVEDKSKITLRRGAVLTAAPIAAAQPAPIAAAAQAAALPAAPAATAAPDPLANLIPVKSPMVGTFYSAASPDAEAFVNIGATIAPDTLVCIIEAMKVFNEIRAEVAGTLVKVLVSNGQTVEYGQPLFLLQPN